MAVFPIQTDGSLGASPQIITHFGALGPNTGRQEAPHPHMVLPDSNGRWVLVNDLGLDTTFVYSFDAGTGKLTEVSRTAAAPGSGPRHLAWHPNGRFVYSINELANTLNTYLWNGNGNIIPMQENLSTLPAGFKGISGAGEVLVDAAGKYLYASNRGDDNILICSIDQATFQLTVIGSVPTQGRTPRHFNFRYRSAAHFLEVFRTWYGPIHKAFIALPPEKGQALEADLTALLNRLNIAGAGSLVVPGEYAEIVIVRR